MTDGEDPRAWVRALSPLSAIAFALLVIFLVRFCHDPDRGRCLRWFDGTVEYRSGSTTHQTEGRACLVWEFPTGRR